MNDIKLLDCTLRDGGYINQWKFGYNTVICCFERLVQAGVNIIEIGFLDERYGFDADCTIQPDTSCYDRIFKGRDKGGAMAVAMIDYGTCGIGNISPCRDSFIDGIRVIFKKPKMKQAVNFARELKEKGYEVFLQMVSITSYSDRDMLDFIELANGLMPYAVSIVDTYGLMHKEKLFHYFDLLDVNLDRKIYIGYHSHNNFQLAYSNAIELVKRNSSHDLIIDGSLFGMGKNAGNAPLELLIMYLNDNCNKNYDLSQVLEIIDVTVSKICKEHSWGYSLPLFIAASADCHPNYVNYLINKKTLSVKSINEILRSISDNDKLNYSKPLIEDLYRKYQKTALCDKNKEKLLASLRKRNVLLIGPGITIRDNKSEIERFMEITDAIVISVNCVPDFKLNYLFVNSGKRYSMLSAVCDLSNGLGIIATSNVSAISNEFEYILNYDSLTDDNELIYDNSLVMMLKLLSQSECGKIYLAGFDGFDNTHFKNYYDEYLDFGVDPDKLLKVNDSIKRRIAQLCERLSINFITNSYYKS